MLRAAEASRKRYPGFRQRMFSVVIFVHTEMDHSTFNFRRTAGRISGLLLLTFIALLIHGYHPYAEDAEIYLPGILKVLNPSLFPANAQFFGEHAGHTLYPNLIAFSVRATHLPLPSAAFMWHLISIFLLLAGSWRLASAFFEDERARWAAVALMAALLTLPIAGTALYILDQYLNPRNLAAFSAIFAVAEVLHRKYWRSALWLIFAALVHPLMASFAIAFCAWLFILRRYRPRALGFAALLPFGLTLDPPPAAYHEVARRQPYFYIQRWEWYEWLGVIGPLLLFWWLARFARRQENENLELVSRAMVPFILAGLAGALVLGIPARFEALARLEPLRCLALTYMVLIVIGGGLLGQYVLQVEGMAVARVVCSALRRNVLCATAAISCQRSGRVAVGAAAQPVGAGI